MHRFQCCFFSAVAMSASMMAQPLQQSGSDQPVLDVPRGAQRPLTQLAFSASGALVIRDDGQTMVFWNVETETARGGVSDQGPSGRTLNPSNRVTLDGRFVWMAGENRELRKASLEPRRPPVPIPVKGQGEQLVAATEHVVAMRHPNTGKVTLVDDRKAEREDLPGGRGSADSVALHPDGNLVAVGSFDGSFVLWNWREKRIVASYQDPQSSITHVVYRPDGKWIGVLSHPRGCIVPAPNGLQYTQFGRTRTCPAFSQVTLLEGTTGKEISSQGTTSSNGIAFHPTKPEMALWDPREVRVVEFGTLQPRLRLSLSDQREAMEDRSFRRVAFSHDGRLLAGAGVSPIRIWDTQTGRQLTSLSDPPAVGMQSVFLTDAGRLVYVVNRGRRLVVTELHPAVTVRSIPMEDSTSDALVHSSNGEVLAAEGRDRTARVWRVDSGKTLCRIPGTANSPRALALDPGGRWLAIASGSDPSGIELWGTASCQKLAAYASRAGRSIGTFWKPAGAPMGVRRIAFSSDGKRLAWATADNVVRVWDTVANTERSSWQAPVPAVFSEPDPNRAYRNVLLGGTREQNVADVNTRTSQLSGLFSFTQLPAGVVGINFSADDSMVAIADQNGQARIWDPNSGALLATLNEIPPERTAFIVNSNFRMPFPTGTVTFFRDGKRAVASFFGNRRASLHELPDGRRIRELRLTAYSEAYLSNDEKVVIGGGGARTVVIEDVESGDEVAMVHAFGDGSQWTATTRAGLFDGTAPALKRLRWRFRAGEAPLQAFFFEFYSPGLLSEIFQGKRPVPPRNLGAVDRRQARVLLEVPGSPATGPDPRRRVTLRIRITPPGDGEGRAPYVAKDLRIFRNGVLLKIHHGTLPASGEGKGIEISQEVTLAAGLNRFTAYCFNADNVRSAEGRVDLEGAVSAVPGKTYLIAVGVNQYSNSDFNLRYAASDAEAVVKELRARSGWTAVELFDNNATKQNVLTALRILSGKADGEIPSFLRPLNKAEPEDRVFFFFAGHGLAYGDRFYLVPHDLGYSGRRSQRGTDKSAQDTILEHSISDRDLSAAIEELDAAQIALVLDACYSGQVLEAAERRQGAFNSASLAQLAFDKGMYVLTASQSYEIALEDSRFGHGLLTQAFLKEGLQEKKADHDPQDGKIDVRELFAFATLRVPLMHREQRTGSRDIVLKNLDGNTQSVEAGFQTPRLFFRRDELFPPWLLVAGGREDDGLEGAWQGIVSAGKSGLPVLFRIFKSDGKWTGTLDVPFDKVKGAAVIPDWTGNDMVLFDVPQLKSRFSGRMAPDGLSIAGTWEGSLKVPLTLHRAP